MQNTITKIVIKSKLTNISNFLHLARVRGGGEEGFMLEEKIDFSAVIMLSFG